MNMNFIRKLPIPMDIKEEFPVSAPIAAMKEKNDAEIKRIERFFRSELFTLYVNGKIEPEYLIKRLRNLVRHKKGIQIWAH